MLYVHVRSEVRTTSLIQSCLQAGQQVVVPYCEGQHLKLFRLHALQELKPGRFGIQEPPEELRTPKRIAQPADLDWIALPGLGFDRQGQRLGYGQGFYDRLLATVPATTTLAGLAYECQLFAFIPSQPHDVPLDLLITPSEVIRTGALRR